MNSATFTTPDGRLVEGRARCEVDGAKLLPCFVLEHTLRRASAGHGRGAPT